MFSAWVVYPLVLTLLCGGAGLLVDFLSGRRLPGALVLPVGLATIVVVGQFTTWSDTTAELTTPLVLALAVAGAGLSWPWRFGRPSLWALAAALGVFFVFGAPVILSGSPTFAGFIKLDDTATWLAMTDRIMEHGRSLAGLAPSTYYATLEFNLASGYPIGAFLPFGVANELAGTELAWVFQPYLCFLAGALSLEIWQIAGSTLRTPGPRALVAFLAAQPALLVGYALWGGVKEVMGSVFVALSAALAPAAVKRDAEPADAVLLAIAVAALVGVLSPGGVLWVAPMLLVLALLAWRRHGTRGAVIQGLWFAVPLGVLLVPVLSAGLVPPTSSPLTDAHAEGNLRGALSVFQVLGIWPSGDFRFHPDASVITAILVALGFGAALFGLWTAWRRRSTMLLLYASALIAGVAIVAIGSPWAGGKALATASPIMLSLAIVGALFALRLDRFAGILLVVAVAGGVLWSNVLAYGGVSLAPYNELVELQQIGEDFAGEGPALMTEYSPYGARHFLRNLDAEAASELRVRTIPKTDGSEVEKGYSADTDELDMGGLFFYRTLVLRRSPVRSRPPAPYRLAWRGRYYEVWQRPEGQTTPPEFLPLGSPLEPSATPKCSEIVGFGQLALLHGIGGARLLAARHAPVYDATDGTLEIPEGGRYTAWLEGSVRGDVELYVNGEKIGSARQRIENEGGFIELGEVELTPGTHEAELRFGGADLHPGSGGFPRPLTGPLLFSPTDEEDGELVSVPVAESERLCGQPWDWIEAVGPTS